ncbi:MAG: L-threonylcarbamoyladenylate synthase RimN [Phormidesmis priestleyi Ana]|uniref:L-threonylcarbamoyladenylate synthase n=1 Tax=Phormidesmis priestleyi Ana TaxID=1666911 RepID=A0A0P8C045_9CYAN|nr:MAG: L-threonylcarbamoyladenylate synthase RimN [Phormidesmis priestleyi Ana]
MVEVSLEKMVASLAERPVLVSFPTDTVPAIATRPSHAELIYRAKRRPPEKPLILMGASLADLLPYVVGNAEAIATWQAITARHWPGQLTLVLPASDKAPKMMNPENTGTLGIRVPNHPLAIELLSQTGPLATTSANLSGQPPLISPVDISQTFPDALILSVAASDHPAVSSGKPSTVVKWTGQGWQVLRQGEVTL